MYNINGLIRQIVPKITQATKNLHWVDGKSLLTSATAMVDSWGYKWDNSWEFPPNSNEDDSSTSETRMNLKIQQKQLQFNKSNYPANSSWTWKNSPFQFSSNVVLCKFRLACGDWTIWKGQLHICFQSSKTRDFQTKYAEYSCWKPLLPKDASPVQFRNHFITVIDKLDPRTIDWACTWTKSVHVWGGLAFHLFTAPPLSLAGKSMKHLHVKT